MLPQNFFGSGSVNSKPASTFVFLVRHCHLTANVKTARRGENNEKQLYDCSKCYALETWYALEFMGLPLTRERVAYKLWSSGVLVGIIDGYANRKNNPLLFRGLHT